MDFTDDEMTKVIDELYRDKIRQCLYERALADMSGRETESMLELSAKNYASIATDIFIRDLAACYDVVKEILEA